jgi:phosphohistidine phosphatase
MPSSFELYLIRHGIAEERGDAWPDDAKRPLTERGISRMRRIAHGLDQLGVAFDVVLTSPLVRTKQTAEVVASVFEPRPPIVAIDSLAPGGSPQAVITDVEKHGKRTRVALVGHEPGIGELAARLAGSKRPLEFKKGAVCRIDVESLSTSGGGTIRWFATPRMLRSLGRDS